MLDKPKNQNIIAVSSELRTRPEDLQAKYQIGKSTYYKRIRYLQITTQKDEQNKVYLTEEQVSQFDQLHIYIQKHGSMIGFDKGEQELKNVSELASSHVLESDYIVQDFPKALGPTALKV
ncbi:hypothetical protein [Gloeothece verrucosa]|uniref:Uncharacterized protein n=1 Tax=Gloeothece verrucosa (strain PCC 7822) TaxID=497965 RepID=E0UJ07_GLOV7|nr:hypothetical protein [Gloeothece verrucosa]ADN14587.1 hypothetical protein Cyan7822_2616 [Gloeothece verrucosa PCC 7822]